MRELENVIERAITLRQGGRVSAADLPPKVLADEAGSTQPADDLAALFAGLPTIDDIERRYLLHVLEANRDDVWRRAIAKAECSRLPDPPRTFKRSSEFSH